MTVLDAIEEARLRAEAFKREEIDALGHQESAHAERCRIAAAVLQDFIRVCDERLVSEVAW